MEENSTAYLIPKDVHCNSNSELQLSIDSDSSDESPKKVKRGILNLLSINSLVCGVEIVSSCAFTYIPPLLLKSGFSEFFMTLILGIAPFIDMITVPVLAEWSDNSTLKYGRRRPVIICLSILLILSMLLVPLSPLISQSIDGDTNNSLHMFILAVGVILLDYSYQAIFNPCEALLSDMMSTCDRSVQTLGFSMYSACLSLGCIIGYLVVCVKWTLIIPLEFSQDQMCFLITTILLIPCLLLTLSNKEVPNKINVNVFEIENEEITDNSASNLINILLPSESFLKRKNNMLKYCKEAIIFKKIEKLTFKRFFLALSLPLVHLLAFVIQTLYFTIGFLKKVLLLPVGCYKRIQMSPVVIQRVFLVELFGWTALHCHDRFFTDFVGQYLYAGDPNAQVNTTEATQYDEGIQMGSWCLFLQSLAACLYAFFIQQHLVHMLGARTVFLGGIFVFFLSMVLTLFLPTIGSLKIATALSGIGTATLTTTPNMLVTQYYSRKDLYMQDMYEEKNANPTKERGLGTEVAVLDMAYYLSQVTLSFFLGPMVEIYKSSLMYIVVSTIASLIALFCAFKVVFTPKEFRLVLEGKF